MKHTVKRISADEARSKAGASVRETPAGAVVEKAARSASPSTWDAEARSARFIMTSEAVDRYGDIVVTSGIDTAEFEKNPVGLLFHNSKTWPVGKWAGLEKMLRGRPPRLEGDLILLPPGGPVKEIDETAWMLENGGIKACSIGFLPNWDEVDLRLDEEGHYAGLLFNKSTLLECSVCAIPANPQALVKNAPSMSMARELIEDILDNYTRTPAGLVVPRADLEAAYREATGNKTISVRSFTVIENKDLESRAVKPDVLAIKADTTAEAAALAGTKVCFNPIHAENKGWPFDEIGKSEGEIIGAWIVESGEYKGALALAVEFLTNEFTGMFRGILAERFILAKAAAAPEMEPEEEPGEEEPEEEEASAGTEDEEKTAEPEVVAPTEPEAGEKQVTGEGRLKDIVNSFVRGLSSLFAPTGGWDGEKDKALEDAVSKAVIDEKTADPEPAAEPEPPVVEKAEPTAEEIATARAAALALRARLVAEGLIPA
jgi:hypothetical protein